MDYDNDCESIFNEDVIDKKKTGRGMYGKTMFTRKRNGGMPSDMLRGKELKKYMGNSEVITYNLNDIKNPEPNKRGKKTTAEDDAIICGMYASGEKLSAITRRFCISAPVVYTILQKNGVTKRKDRVLISDTEPTSLALVQEPKQEQNEYMTITGIAHEVVELLVSKKISYHDICEVVDLIEPLARHRQII